MQKANGDAVVTVDTTNSELEVTGGVIVSGGISQKGVYNVLNYGAIGDGSATDTAAVQAAIDAAEAAGGRTVFFPQGTYKCGALTITAACELVGPATLQMTTNTTLFITISASDVRIDNLKIIGTDQADINQVAIFCETLHHRGIITNCTFTKCVMGVHVNGSSLDEGSTLANGAASAAQKVVTVDSSAAFAEGSYIEYDLVGGVLERNYVATVDSDTQITLTRNIGEGGIANNTPIAILPHRPMGWRVENCTFYDIGLTSTWAYGYGVLFPDVMQCSVIGCTFTNINRHAVYLSSGARYCVVSGNTVDGVVSDSAFKVYSLPTQRATIDNIFSDNTITNTSLGFDLSQKSNYNLISNNIFSNFTDYAIHNVGAPGGPYPTGNVFDGNSFDGYCIGVLLHTNAENTVFSNNTINCKSNNGAVLHFTDDGAWTTVSGRVADVFNNVIVANTTHGMKLDYDANTDPVYAHGNVFELDADYYHDYILDAGRLEISDGLLRQTILPLALTGAADLDLADGADHGTGVKVYDFPAGRISILGAMINASVVCNDAFNASPNDIFYLSCGSVTAADDGDLTGTEADIIPKTTIDTVGNTTLTNDWHAALAASAMFNNTTSDSGPLDLFVNAAVANASTTKAVTLAITGTLQVTWINLGNY